MAFKTDTFIIKGMRQDTSEAVFDTAFAFENKNIRIDARENHTMLCVTQEMGNEQIIEIQLYHDILYQNFEDLLNELPFVVIGHCEIDNYCILFGKNINTDEDIIARLELKNNIFKLVYLYKGTLLNFDIQHPIECLPNIETEQIKKVYFVDGKNSPRAINILKQYPSNNIGDISLGFTLELNETFKVSKIWNTQGHYPAGKVQFAFSYYNDQQTETNLVEVSPMYDCTGIHQAIGPSSVNTSEHSFQIDINNLDTQYNFLRIYLFMFTSSSQPVIRYVERYYGNATNWSERIDYDELDLQDYTGTYSDLMSKSSTIIPYTISTKDNYLFYGNIKEGFPELAQIQFDNKDISANFQYKQIGYEEYLNNTIYHYDPHNTTFKDSSFEYKGFRKHNWYRFGIIAQHYTGVWSNVLFLCDKQCNIGSKTEVVYNNNHIPLRSEYFVPYFALSFTTTGYTKLQQLKQLGFRKIKPVCVVPPMKYRNVVTQGIVCPTMYKGENRKNANNLESKTFAYPSYFYRPKPLTSPYHLDADNNIVLDYSYTLRNLDDLRTPQNYLDGNKVVPDPQMNKQITWNHFFREYRHGFSLPPKHTINAELESSTVTLNDYFFINANTHDISNLFNNSAYNIDIWKTGDIATIDRDLFDFFDSRLATNYQNQNNLLFYKNNWSDVFNISDFEHDANFEPHHYILSRLASAISNIPKKLYCETYNNALFIDEGVCTLNTPEVDLNEMFINGVDQFLLDCDIEICGYSQITASANRTNASSCDAIGDQTKLLHTLPKAQHLWAHCLYPTSTDTQQVYNLLCRNKTPNQPLTYHTGPFWFSPIQVLPFLGKGGKIDRNPYSSSYFKNSFKTDDLNWNDDVFYSHNDFNGHDSKSYICKSCKNLPDGISTVWSWNEELIPHNDNWEICTEDTAMLLYHNIHSDDTNLLIANDIFTDNNWNRTGSHAPKRYQLRRWGLRIGITLQTLKTFNNNSNWSISTTNNDPYGWGSSAIQNDWDLYDDGDITLDDTNHWNYNFDNDANISGHNTLNEKLQWCLGYYNFYPFYARLNVYNPFVTAFTGMVLPTDNIDNFFVQNNNITGWNQLLNSYQQQCLQGNKFTGHYYVPFSTAFPHTAFDQLYACAIYPFLSEQPTYNPLSANKSSITYERSEYNYTYSFLYSNVTNYIDTPERISTYQQLFNNNYINNHDVLLTNLEWLKKQNNYLSVLYNNNPINCINQTVSLVAATKWYRGFKSIFDNSNNTTITAESGYNLSLETFRDNLAFSGMLPQLYNKCGYIPFFYYTEPSTSTSHAFALNHCQNMESYLDIFRDILGSVVPKTLNINYNSTSHIVFAPKKSYHLLPEFQVINDPISGIPFTHQLDRFVSRPELDYNQILRYYPDFYYKIYKPHCWHINDINTMLDMSAMQNNANTSIALTYGPHESIYPHTGTWIDITFDKLTNFNRTTPGLNYWQSEQESQWTNLLALHTSREKINLDFSNEKLLMKFDDLGHARKKENYWLLQLANLYNSTLEHDYLNDNANPYTYEGLSTEIWNWKPCGYSIKIDDIVLINLPNLTTNNTSRRNSKTEPIKFLEGDTYFQKYNSIKTYGHPDQVYQNDISETASVMIESYINLDGYYLDWNTLKNSMTNPYCLAPDQQVQVSINPVYTLDGSSLQTYTQLDYNYNSNYLKHFPTRVMWSVHKINGETTDSWGIVPTLNYYDTLGTCGNVEKLISYNDNVYCLQEHGLSILDFNSKSLLDSSTGNPISIYFQESLRLQNNTYFSRNVGTLNKWSVINTKTGFYWIDDTLKSFYRFPASGESLSPLDLSLSKGFKTWSNNQFAVKEDNIWKPVVGNQLNDNWIANYDYRNNDIYWMNNKYCINYNETLDCFVSFFSYEKVPYLFNYFDKTYALYYNDNSTTTLYQQFANYNHLIFNQPVNNYVELLINTAPTYDKIFNFIEYTNECFDLNDNLIPLKNSYHKLSAINAYQNGTLTFNFNNTKQKFRVWRTEIPRDNHHILDRIRGPWCKLRLERDPLIDNDIYRDQLHYISVNYTIPEQPLKTNSSD